MCVCQKGSEGKKMKWRNKYSKEMDLITRNNDVKFRECTTSYYFIEICFAGDQDNRELCIVKNQTAIVGNQDSEDIAEYVKVLTLCSKDYRKSLPSFDCRDSLAADGHFKKMLTASAWRANGDLQNGGKLKTPAFMRHSDPQTCYNSIF